MITGQTVKNTYQGDGSNREFTITFEFTDSSQVKFKVNGQNVTTNYSLNTVAKTLTYPTVASELDPLTSADEIEIYRDTEITQDIEFNNGGPLNADMIEDGLDKLTMISQEIKAMFGEKESNIKTMADGYNIDDLKEEGIYFVKNPTSTKGLPPAPFSGSPAEASYALIIVYTPPINKGTYYVYQELVLWYQMTGVGSIPDCVKYIRQLSDYTYTTSTWNRLSNGLILQKVTGTEIGISSIGHSGERIIANPDTGSYYARPSTAITSLSVYAYADRYNKKLEIIFKAGSGFTLSVTGNGIYWIGEKPTTFTENGIYMLSVCGNYLKLDSLEAN